MENDNLDLFKDQRTISATEAEGVTQRVFPVSYTHLYGIMVKTMAVVAPLVLHLPAEEIASKHLADTGVLGGIISGAIAAYMFNRFYRQRSQDTQAA